MLSEFVAHDNTTQRFSNRDCDRKRTIKILIYGRNYNSRMQQISDIQTIYTSRIRDREDQNKAIQNHVCSRSDHMQLNLRNQIPNDAIFPLRKICEK